MMKILIGITYYYPNISGVSLYAKRLAEGLAQRGYQITIITSRHLPTLPLQETDRNIRIIRVQPSFKIGKGTIMLKLPFIVFKEALSADIINCHLPQFESFVFALIGKLLGKKVILTHHTDLSGWKGFLNRISEISVWIGQLIAALFSDKIIPYTEDYANHSWFLKLFQKKVISILPPVLVKEIKISCKRQIQEKIGNNNIRIIGFAGRIARQKGIPHLLNAIPYLEKKLTNFKIVFAGPYKEVIGEKYFEEIKPLIKKFQKKLIFLGSLTEEEMPSFYSLCDLLVLPSDDRLESFGLVQAEAMLCGCPVVATNLPGARMPIKMTGMGEIVPPGDSEELAQAILRVLTHKERYLKNFSRAKKIFDYHKVIDNYERLFRTLKENS